MTDLLTKDQEHAVEKFRRLKAGAAFMEQGTGKTRVAVELINANRDRLDRVLYLCPFSTRATVERELEKWEITVPVSVVGYETLSGSDRTYLTLRERMMRGRWMIVADESIFIKNLDSKRTDRATNLRGPATHALILNGSPVTRDLWDLKRQMDFLSPRIIGMTDLEFQSRYFTHVKYKKRGGKPHEFFKEYEPNVAHLHSLIEPYVVWADLDFDLPVTVDTHTHHVSGETEDRYAEAKGKVLDEFNAGHGDAIIGWLMKLNRIANLDPGKIRKVAEAVKGRRVLVYSAWLNEQAMIADAADALVVNGATRPADREELFAEFRASDRPLIMTYGTGSFGLNLHDATAETHFASVIFDFAHMDHARARVRRLGQTRPVSLNYHLSALPISTLIQRNLDRKQWLGEIVRREIDLETVL